MSTKSALGMYNGTLQGDSFPPSAGYLSQYLLDL